MGMCPAKVRPTLACHVISREVRARASAGTMVKGWLM